MNKKMLRQLSLRSGVISKQTAGELACAQAVFQRQQNLRHAFQAFGCDSILQVRMSAPFILLAILEESGQLTPTIAR
jgi:hypothetical protein